MWVEVRQPATYSTIHMVFHEFAVAHKNAVVSACMATVSLRVTVAAYCIENMIWPVLFHLHAIKCIVGETSINIVTNNLSVCSMIWAVLNVHLDLINTYVMSAEVEFSGQILSHVQVALETNGNSSVNEDNQMRNSINICMQCWPLHSLAVYGDARLLRWALCYDKLPSVHIYILKSAWLTRYVTIPRVCDSVWIRLTV
jgi:hypothetical protein